MYKENRTTSKQHKHPTVTITAETQTAETRRTSTRTQ